MFKNDIEPDAENYAAVFATHRMLRVMEAVRSEYGDAAVQRWYLLAGTVVHHDGDRDTADLGAMLERLDFDPKLAEAADDDSWDDEIRRRMDVGLELAGDDIGTPIIAFDNADGERQAYFGPVITRVPPGDLSLKLWDALTAMMDVPGFWELKRTRTESPELGDRPDV